MQHWKAFTLAVVGLALVAATTRRSHGQTSTRVLSATAEASEPPQQRKPWSPPTTALPADLIAATTTLFEQGLADPRGCDYREVEITAGDSTGGGAKQIRTHGWVLPETNAGANEALFAICWNGLVYPARELGPRADLRRDVLAVIQPAEQKRKGAPSPVFGSGWATGERWATTTPVVDRLRTCLLLRLGEEELARRMWSASGEQPRQHEGGPYLDLATDWLWYVFDHTIAAHARGDDAVALAGVRLLVRAQPAVEAKADQLHFKRPENNRQRTSKAPVPYFDFGTDPAELLADQEQRAAERTAVLSSAPEAGQKTPEQRIAALIRQLNEVSERQFAQPGGVDLASSAIVQSLVKEGDPAVTPLIGCLEKDTRLTRSVHYWRNFARHRQLLPVRTAAYEALTNILKTTEFGHRADSGEEDWPALAVSIRAYWTRYQGQPRVERWYRILQDHAAGPEQWLEAASNITFPAGQDGQPGMMRPTLQSFVGPWGSRSGGGGVQGEALRAKTSPSISGLLEKRAAESARSSKSGAPIAFSTATDLALCLSIWDRQAAIPTLRSEFRRGVFLSRAAAPDLPPGFDAQANTMHLALLTLARAGGKDSTALSDYTAWLLSRPLEFPYETRYVFEPLWHYPDDPSVVAVARSMFNTPGSAWGRELVGHVGTGLGMDDPVTSPLLGLASFREMVLRLLVDRSPVGSAAVGKDGQLDVKSSGSELGTSGVDTRDPRVPRPGVRVRFRRCDLVAWNLSRIAGAPEIEPYWPEADRAAAVGQMTHFLRRYGPRMKYSELQMRMDQPSPEPTAMITFPALGRTARPQDLSQSRAIFSLQRLGVTRLVSLPSLPMRARWTTLRKHPYETQIWDEQSRKVKSVTEYNRDGWVWQAEEVKRNGRWERFYGFVGPHEISMAPAGEIEFPGNPYLTAWGELSGGVDCRVRLSGETSPLGVDPQKPPRVTAPPSIEVLLRNRGGLPKKLPAEYLRRSAGAVALLAGVRLQLQRSPLPPMPGERTDPEAELRRHWEEVNPRAQASFPVGERGRRLEPTETIQAFSLKLDELYDLTTPALYRLTVVWSGSPGVASGKSNEVLFVLRP